MLFTVWRKERIWEYQRPTDDSRVGRPGKLKLTSLCLAVLTWLHDSFHTIQQLKCICLIHFVHLSYCVFCLKLFPEVRLPKVSSPIKPVLFIGLPDNVHLSLTSQWRLYWNPLESVQSSWTAKLSSQFSSQLWRAAFSTSTTSLRKTSRKRSVHISTYIIPNKEDLIALCLLQWLYPTHGLTVFREWAVSVICWPVWSWSVYICGQRKSRKWTISAWVSYSGC